MTEEQKDEVKESKKVDSEKETVAEEEEIEELEIISENMFTVNLGRVWIAPTKKRAPRAINVLKEYVKRHMKSEEIVISNEVNEQIWAKGIEKPPRRLRIRAVKDKENRVIVFPSKS